MGKPIIKNIALPKGLFTDEVTVCLLQLRTPFGSEVTVSERKRQHYFEWNSELLLRRRQRIAKLLTDISVLGSQRKINLLVFPEYSIEEGLIDVVRQFSRTSRISCLLNYYAADSRRGVSHMLVPFRRALKEYLQYKLSPSRFEADVVSRAEGIDRYVNRYHWSHSGIRYYLQPMICHDYPMYACETIDIRKPGIVIVQAHSPVLRGFIGLAEHFVRRTESSGSLVFGFSNATDLTITPKNYSCGNSQFVGTYDKDMPVVDAYREGGMIATIRLAGIVHRQTRYSESNYVVSALSKFRTNDDGAIVDVNNEDGDQVAIDPNVILKHLNLKKIYVFFNSRNYYEFSRYVKAKYIPFQCNGIFGNFDLLFQGYEETWDYFQRRLVIYLGPRYADLTAPEKSGPEHYVVTDVIKYRGIMLVDIDAGRFNVKYKTDEVTCEYVRNKIRSIRDIITNVATEREMRGDLLRRGILITVEGPSDVSRHEKKLGYDEFLVFVTLFQSSSHTIQNAFKSFYDAVIPLLVNDRRVKTIEFCNEQNIDVEYPIGKFIIHVVGKSDDLRDIVIDTIHKPMQLLGVLCSTKVIPNAETLSVERYISLKETVLRDKDLQDAVREIVFYLNIYSNPFVVKELCIEHILRIVQVYRLYKSHIRVIAEQYLDVERRENRIRESMEPLNRYIYGMSDSLLKTTPAFIKEDMDLLRSRCSELFNSLAIRTEEILAAGRARILECLTKKAHYHAAIEKAKIFADRETTALGVLVRDIATWNERVSEPEDVLIGKDFTRDVKKLNSAIHYRNSFSHTEKTPPEDAISKYAESVLDTSVYLLEFITKYYREFIPATTAE